MQVEDFLETSARRSPDKAAIVCNGRRWKYGQVEEHSNALGHALIGEGIRRWDRVAIYLDNSIEAVLSVFAVLKSNAVFLIINPTVKPEKLTYIINNCRATGLITDSKKLGRLEGSLSQMPYLNIIVAVGGESGERYGE